ncbi:HAMP domain-containing sensor histidine kinase [Vibrio hannami]|nr:HAMP domain-containing sensor histidine kinase [Vibrio hannami]MDG3085773.1 HAMP domain-containing sensor histidine kinase [Vibrio hannami]
MLSDAYNASVSDGKPVVKAFRDPDGNERDKIVIASRWEDLPELVQQNFTEQELELNELHKKLITSGTFSLEPPKAGTFLLKSMFHGDVRYAAIYFYAENREQVKIGRFPHVIVVLFIALAAILLFSLILSLLMRKVSKPIEHLKNWAKSIDESDLKTNTPDFQYRELNTLADIIKSSFKSVRESAEREKRFLGFASHELRTPIAVTRTNGELLRKLIEKEKSKEKQLEVLERIERAGLTMTDLTETLLWLNRQEDKELPVSKVPLGSLVSQINEELVYLLENKRVDVNISTDDSILLLPEPLCRIIITNLLRNAFQHTNEGDITIKQTAGEFVVTNKDISTHRLQPDLGFGLGLELSEKLIARYGWRYINKEHNSDEKETHGREVSLIFHN